MASPERPNARYLEQLVAWGYGLSDVEHIVIDTVAEKAGTKAAEETAKATE